jgi:putative ABC transport system substrate-binding protein
MLHPQTAACGNALLAGHARAVKHRLPLAYPYRHFTAAGGLFSYGPDTVDQYRLAASYVDRTLKRERPAIFPCNFR